MIYTSYDVLLAQGVLPFGVTMITLVCVKIFSGIKFFKIEINS